MKSMAPHPTKKARIEVIPLIDVVFFLLATFVLVSLSLTRRQGVPVELPKVVEAPPQDIVNTVTISVTELGALYWEDRVLTWDQFVASIDRISTEAPDTKLMLNADQEAPFGQTASVLDEIRKAGFKSIAIITEQKR